MTKNKKKAITFCTSVVFLAASLTVSSFLKTSQISQSMADRWSSDGSKYAQVSVFFPEGNGSKREYEAKNIHDNIESKMKEDSYKADNSDARVWADAYCSKINKAHVSFENIDSGREAGSADVNVIGVSEDFFEFHPLKLLSGEYIYSGELSGNRIVLDENAAWAIFSSIDVTGMKIELYGKTFEVSGVVRAEDNKVTEQSYTSYPIVYIHYSVLEEIGMDDSLMCYEAIVPDPVDNYAKNILLEYYGINTMKVQDDKDEDPEEAIPVIVIDNTNRYSVSNLYNNLKSFGKNSVIKKPIAFPYWENAARITDTWLTLVFFIIIVLTAYILINIIVFISKLYLNRTWHLKDYIEKFTDKYTYKKKTSDYITSDINEKREESKYEE